MRIKGTLTRGVLISLAFALIPVTAVSAQKITPGSTCKVLQQKVTYQNKRYTCIKSGKKLVWNKGVAVVKPTPTPTPTTSATPTTSTSKTMSGDANNKQFLKKQKDIKKLVKTTTFIGELRFLKFIFSFI